MTTTTRYIGTCAICFRNIKLRNSRLVHHGYQRPGTGYIEGDCFGVGYEPHEISSKCARNYRDFLIGDRDNLQRELKDAPKQTYLLVIEKDYLNNTSDLVTLEKAKDPKRFKKELKNKIGKLEDQIRSCNSEIQRMDHLLKDWKPGKIISVEEGKAHKQLEKNERQKAAQKKRDEKVRALIEKCHKRLASASRRRTASVFIQIFENAPGQLYEASGGKIGREEAYRLLGINDVWEKLGLLKDGKPVHVRKDGRYVSYNIPFDIQNNIEEMIKDGVIGELTFSVLKKD